MLNINVSTMTPWIHQICCVCLHLGEARRTAPPAPARSSHQRASPLWLWCTAGWRGSSPAPPASMTWEQIAWDFTSVGGNLLVLLVSKKHGAHLVDVQGNNISAHLRLRRHHGRLLHLFPVGSQVGQPEVVVNELKTAWMNGLWLTMSLYQNKMYRRV